MALSIFVAKDGKERSLAEAGDSLQGEWSQVARMLGRTDLPEYAGGFVAVIDPTVRSVGVAILAEGARPPGLAHLNSKAIIANGSIDPAYIRRQVRQFAFDFIRKEHDRHVAEAKQCAAALEHLRPDWLGSL